MKKRFIIGIDLGGTNLKIGLTDLKFRIIYKHTLNTDEFRSKAGLISGIVDSVKKIKNLTRLKNGKILGVGIGFPGPIDSEKGVVHFLPNIPGWKEVALRTILKNKLKIPVFLDNDANLMALAEHRLGAAKAMKNVLCLTLGTGVGGGIIFEGNLYRGSTFAAGEIGHVPLNEVGPSCNCKGKACLEAYIGNNRIIEEARQLFERNISLEELSRLASRGNTKARNLWRKAGGHLGVALAGAVNLLNPDGIIIGGGVANAGEILFREVRKTVKLRAMAVQSQHVKICKAKLGSDAGVIGAAILVKENIKNKNSGS